MSRSSYNWKENWSCSYLKKSYIVISSCFAWCTTSFIIMDGSN
jgi:hypothetical protein